MFHFCFPVGHPVHSCGHAEALEIGDWWCPRSSPEPASPISYKLFAEKPCECLDLNNKITKCMMGSFTSLLGEMGLTLIKQHWRSVNSVQWNSQCTTSSVEFWLLITSKRVNFFPSRQYIHEGFHSSGSSSLGVFRRKQLDFSSCLKKVWLPSKRLLQFWGSVQFNLHTHQGPCDFNLSHDA